MDWVQWAAIGTVVAAIIAIGSVIVRLIDRLNKAEAIATTAKTDADELSAMVAAHNAHTMIEFERIKNESGIHRVAIAERYVSKEDMRDYQKQILEAIQHLTERFDNFMKQRS